ncbi:hypothetical protein BT96DRAFT_948374 [Gymnopus androsaceus JB14]|uniref:Uncharacterized protein n=1 Tax=Gymnopus androsaceus JB14 TaxID=1447944 RepID=A0A6A4GNP3_9AGAR|nr:hypothetical protein BT96DRAFT_948374 [Gymnopus androsaceus JB14]
MGHWEFPRDQPSRVWESSVLLGLAFRILLLRNHWGCGWGSARALPLLNCHTIDSVIPKDTRDSTPKDHLSVSYRGLLGTKVPRNPTLLPQPSEIYAGAARASRMALLWLGNLKDSLYLHTVRLNTAGR